MSDNHLGYRFCFGPWNIDEGADSFGPPTRPSLTLAQKLDLYQEYGFDAAMFHDDDAVPDIENLKPQQIEQKARETRKMLEDRGLVAELAAPRVWEDPRGVDGPFTSNDAKARQWGIERAKQCADVCEALGTNLMVLWFAREGTYARETKNALDAYKRLVEAINAVLEYNANVHILIEPKPNEPMDHAYVPTIGHALAMAHRTVDPARVGGLIESAHCLLAGLDPSDEMAFALAADKLWSVHLNDQNGLKYDQDKAFGAANLRSAFNQVRILENANYQGYITFDTKAMRTTDAEHQMRHVLNSRDIFLQLVQKVRSWNTDLERQYVEARDYEGLEAAILQHLMGVS
jgi:xylose isomerase